MALASGLLGRQRLDADLDENTSPTRNWAQDEKLASLPCFLSLSASQSQKERQLYERGLAFCLGLPYTHHDHHGDQFPKWSSQISTPSESQNPMYYHRIAQQQPKPQTLVPHYPYNPIGAASVAGLGFVKGLVKGKSLSDSSYGVPDSTYAVPESSYGAPESSYGAPDLNYGAPEPTYGAPHQTYATPEDTYTTPEEENDEYGSPTAPAIVELIKAEKLEEHSESGAELLQENAVDKVLIGTPQDNKMIKMGITSVSTFIFILIRRLQSCRTKWRIIWKSWRDSTY